MTEQWITSAQINDDIESIEAVDDLVRLSAASTIRRAISQRDEMIALIKGAAMEHVRRLRKAGLRVGMYYGCDTAGMMADRIQELEAEVKRKDDALSDLMTVQNGPPLIREEDAWNKAMAKAEEALAPKPAEKEDAL